MRADRLLFAGPSGAATLAPIYAALLALVAIGLLQVGVACWIAPPEPGTARASSEAPPPRMRATQGRVEVPPEPLPRNRLKSM